MDYTGNQTKSYFLIGLQQTIKNIAVGICKAIKATPGVIDELFHELRYHPKNLDIESSGAGHFSIAMQFILFYNFIWAFISMFLLFAVVVMITPWVSMDDARKYGETIYGCIFGVGCGFFTTAGLYSIFWGVVYGMSGMVQGCKERGKRETWDKRTDEQEVFDDAYEESIEEIKE